jgi:hypothetical protein
VRFVLREHYSIDVPEIEIPESQHEASKLMRTSPELNRWIQVPDMVDGQIIMMARRNVPLHIGLSVKANGYLGILHCAEPAGVIYQTIHGLQASGFGRLTHYRRNV